MDERVGKDSEPPNLGSREPAGGLQRRWLKGPMGWDANSSVFRARGSETPKRGRVWPRSVGGSQGLKGGCKGREVAVFFIDFAGRWCANWHLFNFCSTSIMIFRRVRVSLYYSFLLYFGINFVKLYILYI